MATPPSIRVCDVNANEEEEQARPSHTLSIRNKTALSTSPSHGPMSIPNTNEPLAPPPLPPPRFIEDLAQGHDPGWKWGNSFADEQQFGKPTLAPIKPSSSLMGGHARPPLVRRDETFSFNEEYAQGGVDTMTAPTGSSAGVKLPGPSPTSDALSPGSVPSSFSSSRMGQLLQGEKPLSEKCVERSSNAYDQHLLSKIGKPSSPPRLSSSLGTSLNKEMTSLPFHSKTRTSISSLSTSDALSPRDLPPRWASGPPSASISPSTKLGGWPDYLGFQSTDNLVHSPMEIDHFSHARERYGGSTGRRGTDEAMSLPSRSNRGSYEQGIFPDSDVDFSMEDSGGSRQHHSRDRGFIDGFSTMGRHGIKRRASSPPRGANSNTTHTFPPSNAAGDLERRQLGFRSNSCTSPNTRYPGYGSVSSMSSSLRTESYASSAGLSVAASSISSFDRPSPGGISPTSDREPSYDRAFVSPGSHRPSFVGSVDLKGPPSRKGSTQNGANLSKTNAPKVSLGRLYICDCCPKKPKKLDSLEELRAHEMEKQYTCSFCKKRFKNKNEAERHQNSLHLRRHSWSCASLSSYESAFHPSVSPTCQTPSGPSHDTCGYCGTEFANFPQAEWDRRIEHLTSVHKFGECNQAKKFYRADHFRQHLKHSHAGSSGKWTNILENACMKEELQHDGSLPSIGEQPGSSENLHQDTTVGSVSGSLATHTIDEVLEDA